MLFMCIDRKYRLMYFFFFSYMNGKVGSDSKCELQMQSLLGSKCLLIKKDLGM